MSHTPSDEAPEDAELVSRSDERRARKAVEEALVRLARDLVRISDKNLEKLGSHKSKILTAVVYVADIRQKPELNRAWDEWADRANPPMRACIGVQLEGKDLVEIIVTATT